MNQDSFSSTSAFLFNRAFLFKKMEETPPGLHLVLAAGQIKHFKTVLQCLSRIGNPDGCSSSVINCANYLALTLCVLDDCRDGFADSGNTRDSKLYLPQPPATTTVQHQDVPVSCCLNH